MKETSNYIENFDNFFNDDILEIAKKDSYYIENNQFDPNDYFSYVVYKVEIAPTFSWYHELANNSDFEKVNTIINSLIEEKRMILYSKFGINTQNNHFNNDMENIILNEISEELNFKTSNDILSYFNLEMLNKEIIPTIEFYNNAIKNLNPCNAKCFIDSCLNEKKQQLFSLLGYEDIVSITRTRK